MGERYTLVVSHGCPYCKKAILLLLEHKKNCQVHHFEWDSEELKELKEYYNHNTVPICLRQEADGEEMVLIGGCDDLEAHLNGEAEEEE